MENVTKLPTAATSYYTVHKYRGYYAVYLVTPCPGKDIKTRLEVWRDRDAAIDAARNLGKALHRPFIMRGPA
jgi:hypothetical protein